MQSLQICLLGELTVSRSEARVALPKSRKTRALLAFLLLNPGPQRRERLCEILWEVPDDPRGALRWSLSKLRQLVNDDRVQRLRADREHVEFDPTECVVDIVEIRKRLSAGVESLDTTTLAGLADELSVELLAGLELPDQSEYHYFLSSARQEVKSLRCSVLRELSRRSGDEPVEAVRWLRALVEAEPYEVNLHQQLIEALARAGLRKEAERQKKVSLDILKDLDGVDPIALERAVHARPQAGPAPSPPAKAPLHQEIRFCKAADGVQIAYASVGQGPPLVKTANWLNHLEFDWESPVWRHVFRYLADGRRLIRYDARGNGLSDWDTDEYGLESLVNDLEAVVDAAGLDRFPLLGISQGCAVSVVYAARHPERVSKLVLIGGYARGWNRLGSAEAVRQMEAMMVLVRIGWGQDNPAFRQLFTSLFMPDAPVENQRWFNELQRMTSSAENAIRLLRACGDVDVRPYLPQVQAPTLVLHATHDMRIPFDSGRELAGGIPGARFVSLETRNHIMPETDPAWARLMAEVGAFLAQ
jgi:pimeloyl-ACP methyl ester carboxylesterase/DNA-binding SARP family transcriptional activator